MTRAVRLAVVAVRVLPAAVRRVLARLLFAAEAASAPREALSALLVLDADLGARINEAATRYGSGIHPKHRFTGYHDFFVARLTPGERVLDVGCGNGALAYSMATRGGAQVTAVDVNEEVLAQARDRFPHAGVRYVHGDACTLDPQEPFDTVVLSNVLEHIQDRVALLAHLKSAAGGQRFLIRVPMFDRDWTVPMRQELGLPFMSDPSHYTEYTLSSFHQEMTAAGLVVTAVVVRWGEIWAEARRA